MLLLKFIVILLPWKVRRIVMAKVWKYDLSPTARIGISWVFPKKLVMAPGSSIASTTIVRNLDEIRLEESARIGPWNWITAFPSDSTKHYLHIKNRVTKLEIRKHASLTGRHIVDCTAPVLIEEYATVAGYRSQLLTHSIDVYACRQDCRPITVGKYSFVGTGSILVGGAVVPAFCVVAAGSVVTPGLQEERCLYGGVPAKKLKTLGQEAKYLDRKIGHVA